VLNALVSLNLFDASNSVGGRKQVNPFGNPAGENREAKASTKLRGTTVVRYSLVNTRSNGTPQSNVGMVR